MHNVHPKQVPETGEELHIPFRLGSELALKSIVNPTLKAKTTLYGVVPCQAIIIEEPLFSLNERLSGLSEGFSCGYMHGNYLYTFKSNYSRRLFKNVIAAEFPQEVRRVQIRSSTRIPVNIESKADLGTSVGTLSGRIEDISERGCRLQLPGLIEKPRGTKFSLSFKLPDGRLIDDMSCEVMNMKYQQDERVTKIGTIFCGPEQTVMKVQEFCRMALYLFVF